MPQAQNATDMSATLASIAELSGLSEAEVKAMYEQARKGASVAEMFRIPPASLEAGYALACNLYAAGKTHDAETMYRALCQYDSETPRNWIGLGCCLEKRAEYREAVFCFARAAELGYPLNAKPLYLLAQCCCSIQDKEAARKVLEVAVVSGDEADPVQARYRQMAQELLATLA
ncbi:MAG: hypothetical protein E7022_10615 [Desulfovibrio desulfuricans]|nr:hypothetical protein [Desulfovibrio desulfuricans]